MPPNIKLVRSADHREEYAMLIQAPDGVFLAGSPAEKASAQDTRAAAATVTYTRAANATQIEVYVESGSIRVRTDGNPATAATGEPLGAGFSKAWAVGTLSVHFVSNSVITVVSR